ncbi:MAG: hypothetical protein DYH13_10560 [Alphaproteobacteria bacterium PRO2]|nr:hypothetical protein [Alphaproteobacteria bacterium PRO2]
MKTDIEGICGAKTRLGTPCKRQDLLRGGRCRLHGGLSTGPKTLEGKRRSALNTGKTYEQLLEERSEESNASFLLNARLKNERKAMSKKVMKEIEPDTGLMQCQICGDYHYANLRSEGRYKRGSFQCRHGCELSESDREER